MGNSHYVDGRAPIHTFYSSKSWIEGDAARQLETVAARPGVTAVAGMPDLHPGKYGPVGCAVLSNLVHPDLVGSDIGCGMGLFQLGIEARRVRADKAADRLRVLADAWDGDARARRETAGIGEAGFDAGLGTIGGGNHFCELQSIAEIVDADAATAVGLDAQAAFLLVHSGSRGLGYSILEPLLANGIPAFDAESETGRAYLSRHDEAVEWARLNRAIIAERAAEALRAGLAPICDLAHNLVEATPRGFLHRKGAAASDRGLVPVPGSRGTLSYLVAPTGAALPETLASIAHGAGRRYDRRSMHGRIGNKRSALEPLARNPFGGQVVCEDRDMLVEEAPDAYKPIGRVIDDLVSFGLARVVASFRPIVTFKSVKKEQERERTRHRPRDFVDKRDRDGEDWR